jgi:hypothetical protein
MEETMGLNAEVESSFNNFCLMTTTQDRSMASPREGGFARTNIAKKNFELSLPWLKKTGLSKK